MCARMNWTPSQERVIQTLIHDPKETLAEVATFLNLPIAFVRAHIAISIVNAFWGRKSKREIKDLCKNATSTMRMCWKLFARGAN